MGRPSTFSEETVAAICERLSAGEPLAAICRDEGMPHPSTVRDWAAARAEVALAIARAREDGFDQIAMDALRIADTQVEGERRKTTADGIEVTTEDMLGHRKLQVETRLKLLAKWDPKRYGDRQQIEHSGKVRLEELVAGEEKPEVE